jgi:hypothetical protein
VTHGSNSPLSSATTNVGLVVDSTLPAVGCNGWAADARPGNTNAANVAVISATAKATVFTVTRRTSTDVTLIGNGMLFQ